MADVGARPVTVVRQRLYQQRDAAGPVALVQDRLDLLRISTLPRSLGDGTLDVVLGHGGIASLLDRQCERGIALRIAATFARRDRDRPSELCELLPSTGIDGRLLVLDRVPFGVTRHTGPSLVSGN